MVLSAAGTATVAVGGRQGDAGGEFPDGEGHGAEQLAGVVGCGGYALLVRNGVFLRRDEILRRTDKTHEGKDAQ